MRSRPLPVTVATNLFVLLSLSNFPFLWELSFPGVEEPPAFIIYAGIVLGLVGLVIAVGLWLLKRWSFLATLIVAVLNVLLAAPGVVEAPLPEIRALVAVTVLVAILIIVLMLLPSSRRAFQRLGDDPATS